MTKSKRPGTVCAAWWHQTFESDDGLARTTRSQLHRCSTAAEALTVEAVHDLNKRLREAGHRPGADTLALIAVVLAHIEQSGALKLANAFGRRNTKGAPRPLSETRFQGLVRATASRDLVAPLRRAIAIVRRNAIDIAALAGDLYYWNERTRNKWCFQYFGAGDATPEQTLQEAVT